jgi:TPR repeat protein
MPKGQRPLSILHGPIGKCALLASLALLSISDAQAFCWTERNTSRQISGEAKPVNQAAAQLYEIRQQLAREALLACEQREREENRRAWDKEIEDFRRESKLFDDRLSAAHEDVNKEILRFAAEQEERKEQNRREMIVAAVEAGECTLAQNIELSLGKIVDAEAIGRICEGRKKQMLRLTSGSNSKSLIEQSSSGERSNALYRLGRFFAAGTVFAKDDPAAVHFFRKAADQGLAEAQFSLASGYANGRGVVKDEPMAAYWYRKAAEQGHAKAQNNLGNMYYYGRGVTQDKPMAENWYRKAADQGNAIAQKNLSKFVD